jgi:hypothetical protein
MHLPLRLTLKPSLLYFLFLASGHILAGVAVCLLPFAFWLRGLVLLSLVLLFWQVWRTASRGLPTLLLHSNGKLDFMQEGYEPLSMKATVDTLVWPWLVVLHLDADAGRKRKPLVIFPDGLTVSDGHRQLRLWLRWVAKA